MRFEYAGSFRNETYGDLKKTGCNIQGRIAQGRNLQERNVQGRITITKACTEFHGNAPPECIWNKLDSYDVSLVRREVL